MVGTEKYIKLLIPAGEGNVVPSMFSPPGDDAQKPMAGTPRWWASARPHSLNTEIGVVCRYFYCNRYIVVNLPFP